MDTAVWIQTLVLVAWSCSFRSAMVSGSISKECMLARVHGSAYRVCRTCRQACGCGSAGCLQWYRLWLVPGSTSTRCSQSSRLACAAGFVLCIQSCRLALCLFFQGTHSHPLPCIWCSSYLLFLFKLPFCVMSSSKESILLLRAYVIRLSVPGLSRLISHVKVLSLNCICKVPFTLPCSIFTRARD